MLRLEQISKMWNVVSRDVCLGKRRTVSEPQDIFDWIIDPVSGLWVDSMNLQKERYYREMYLGVPMALERNIHNVVVGKLRRQGILTFDPAVDVAPKPKSDEPKCPSHQCPNIDHIINTCEILRTNISQLRTWGSYWKGKAENLEKDMTELKARLYDLEHPKIEEPKAVNEIHQRLINYTQTQASLDREFPPPSLEDDIPF